MGFQIAPWSMCLRSAALFHGERRFADRRKRVDYQSPAKSAAASVNAVTPLIIDISPRAGLDECEVYVLHGSQSGQLKEKLRA